jgi:hypothetical protein
MASQWIQGNNTTAAGSSSPITLQFATQNTAAGRLLCGVVRCNSTATLTGVSDNQSVSNSYTIVSLGIAGSTNGYFVYALNTKGGTKATLSFTFSGTVSGVVISIAEYPLAVAASLRTSNTGSATGTNPTSAAVSPVIGDLLILAVADSTGITTSTLSAGTCGASATLHPGGTISGGVTTFAVFEDGIANSGSSQTANLTYATSTTYNAGLFAFAPPASGGGDSNGGLLKLLGVN